MAERTCKIDGCSNPAGVPGTAHGWCSKHYMRWIRHGNPNAGGAERRKTPTDPLRRFWHYVDLVNGCWVWTGELQANGYGRIWFDGDHLLAHRWSYERFVDDIAEDLTIDHKCRNRACVNPDHLEPVGRGENVLRGQTIPAANAAKTHCIRGHEFTPENTRVYRGGRVCKACKRERASAARRG